MLKNMVFTLSTVFALALLPVAFSADQGQKPTGQKPTEQKEDQAKFQEKKQRYLEHLDKRIAALQKAKTCVAQAQTKEALRDCRPEHEHEHEAYHDRDHDRDRGKSKD